MQARSVVVAVGYWHNEFMKKHFVTEDCPRRANPNPNPNPKPNPNPTPKSRLELSISFG